MTIVSACAACGSISSCVHRGGHRQGYGDHGWRKRSQAMRTRQPWCSACGSASDLVADHIVPIGAGGSDHPDNLRVLCRSCNSARAGRLHR